MRSFLGGNARIATTVLMLTMMVATLVAPSAHAQTFTTLYTFTGGTDGAFPYGPLVVDSAGNLYGTTSKGGQANGCGGPGCGTVFKLSSLNTETVLYTFTGPGGVSPYAGLLRDKAGNLWGTAYYGGSKSKGTVFKINGKTSKESVLHSFKGADGENPIGGLIADSAGNHYGTTYIGGGPVTGSACGISSCGTVYKLDKTNKETVLYTFTGNADGGGPYYENLVRDAAGNLYGTLVFGGNLAYCNGLGCGAVFKLDPTGHESILYGFTGNADGGSPRSGLVLDSAGNLYGTTQYGGLVGSCIYGYGCGTVFKIDAFGNFSVLYTFTGGADGGNPFSTLVLDSKGNLYGNTNAGAFGYGTIFKVDAAGNETTLYQFTGGADGGQPITGLVRDSAGSLYGTTLDRGSTGCTGIGCGTVFKLTP